jgi:hypothetical protein
VLSESAGTKKSNKADSTTGPLDCRSHIRDNVHTELQDLMERIDKCFDQKMYLSLSEAAVFIGVSTKTLRRHAQLGNIDFSRSGFGRKKLRRRFTACNIAKFCLRLSRGTTVVPRRSRAR